MSAPIGLILATVNAPYAGCLTAGQLAEAVSDKNVASFYPGHVFSFICEVPISHQEAFLKEFGIDDTSFNIVLDFMSDMSGKNLPFLRKSCLP